MISRWITLAVILLSASIAQATDPVFRISREAPLQETYDKVYRELETNRFFVVFEADIGRNISRFAEKWGEDYNRSGLEGIRAMVVCNAWYTNQVANRDPDMLALCPLSVTLIHKNGVTTALFARPTITAAGSEAEPVLREVETEIVRTLEKAMQ
jgi:uncharacterized protein (DUF302 family)